MLSVVVLTKNSAATIGKCLESIVSSTYPPSEIVVVDGGSSDNTLDIVRGFEGRAKIKVLFDEGKGLGYARDIGWRAAGQEAKYVAMVDSDVVVNKDFFAEALRVLESDERAGAVGAKLKPVTDESGILALFQTKNLAVHLHWREPPYPHETVAVHTACTVFRRSALEKVGGFDPFFSLAKEDSDVSLRLRKAGFRLHYLDIYSQHLETGRRFWRINFRYGRSYVLFAQKHPVEGKLLNKKNLVLTTAILIPPLQLAVWAYYLYRYSTLQDLSTREKLLLSLTETVRQDVRTLGMLYELASRKLGKSA